MPDVSLDDLDRAIDQAAGYLVLHVEQDGRFVYRVHLDDNVDIPPKYNMLRHAGSIYALTQYHDLRPNVSTRRVLVQAGRFLQSQIDEAPEVPDVLAVWSNPGVNHGTDPRKAKLGGTGLGLVALTRLERIEPELTPSTTLEQLGNFLLFMQKDDGSFYSTFHPDFPGRDDSWTSLYYPGEAALGLLLLHDCQPDQDWVAGASEALTYLARSRANQKAVPADHWALLATAQLFSLSGSDREEVNAPLLIGHAAQICRHMLAEQKPQNGNPTLKGCFSPDGRTTPTATRLEGLQAALTFLPKKEFSELRSDIQIACHLGVRFLLDAQIKNGRCSGGIPRAIAQLPRGAPLWTESFNQRAGEIRIDYVQHALSAWLQYRQRLAVAKRPGE